MTALGPTIGYQVISALSRYPDRPAFIRDGGALSYRAVLDLIGRYQAVFASRGIRRGLHVALLTGNRAEGWCAGAALQAMGVVVTWLHPLGAIADQLAQLEDFGAEALVVDTVLFGDRGGEIAGRSAQPVLTLGKSGYGFDIVAAAERIGTSQAVNLADAMDVAQVNYTGGTTGKSKGAFRRHASFTLSTVTHLADFEIPATPRYLAMAPISHVSSTMILPTFLRGGSVWLQDGFDPERMLRTIATDRINLAILVPTMIYMLLDNPALDRVDLSSLELLLYGASPMSPTRLREGLARIGPVFAQLYGQTECHPVAYLPRADHDPAREDLLSACGFSTSSSEVRLIDNDGRDVATGEPGEIIVRAPQMMEGYLNEPDLTHEAFVDGWLRTGDVARRDEEGRLYIVDRKKDLIVTGGFNIYPRDVEDCLSAHAAVSRVAVIGVPDEKWGEAVRAVVVLKPGERPDQQALIAHVKAQKGSLHAPKSVDFVASLPLTGLGKVDKKALRAGYWAGQSRDVG